MKSAQDRKRWWWVGVQMTAHAVACAYWHLRVTGREHIPTTGGCLLASNHQSYLDPALVATTLDREVHFMARQSLFRIPGFGSLITAMNSFAVERGSGDVGAVKMAISRLQAGNVLLMFPEGTRTRDGELGRVKPGIAMIARRAGVPIVPVLVQGAYRLWPRQQLLPAIGAITVSFGPPFRLKPDDPGDAFVSTWTAALKALRET